MIPGVLRLGRSVAEGRMTETVIVTRGGEKSWDETAGKWVESRWTVYSGRARVKQSSHAGKKSDSGSQLTVVSQPEVHLPVTVDAEPGDLIEVTASTVSELLVGRVFTVMSPFDGGQVTAGRYRVEVADER